jgi:CDP-2,3-bis-(O-geranylgeranyl)-sn-glycerol synthase
VIDVHTPLGFLTFFIPAYVANMVPVFVRKLRVLNIPLDGGLTWNDKPLLGKNKTVRGLVFGTLSAGLAGAVLQWSGFAFVWWWGLVLGFAALVGDAIKSMFKRQMGIRPGGSWMPFDQLDFMAAALLASLAFTTFSAKTVLIGLAVVFICNVIVQLIGGWTRLKADSL